MVKQIADKPSERSDSKFRGVRKRKWGKWVSEIRLPNSRERIWLGSYDSAVKAARAFDAAMFCLRGRSGNFNFPDNPPDISFGRSMTPAQIQAAAARFANSEHGTGRSDKPMTLELAEESPSHSLLEATVVPVESSSPSLSEATVQTDSEMTVNESVSDLFKTVGSGNYANEYGIFAGFDDLTSGFYIPEMPSVNYDEENMDGLIIDGSFLWNF